MHIRHTLIATLVGFAGVVGIEQGLHAEDYVVPHVDSYGILPADQSSSGCGGEGCKELQAILTVSPSFDAATLLGKEVASFEIGLGGHICGPVVMKGPDGIIVFQILAGTCFPMQKK